MFKVYPNFDRDSNSQLEWLVIDTAINEVVGRFERENHAVLFAQVSEFEENQRIYQEFG